MEILTEKYRDKISFTLGCYDRVIIKGTLLEIAYAQGMTNFLYKNKTRIFDYARFAEPYKDKIRQNAQKLAQDSRISPLYHPLNNIQYVENSALN